MTRERHLRRRREDPNPSMTVALRREGEHGLGELHLSRERLVALLGDVAGVREDGELIPLERPIGEDVGDDVPMGGHGLSKPPGARVTALAVRYGNAWIAA